MGHILNTFGFTGHKVSVTTTQLYPCSMEAATDMETEKHGCVPIKRTGSRHDLAYRLSLANSELNSILNLSNVLKLGEWKLTIL